MQPNAANRTSKTRLRNLLFPAKSVFSKNSIEKTAKCCSNVLHKFWRNVHKKHSLYFFCEMMVGNHFLQGMARGREATKEVVASKVEGFSFLSPRLLVRRGRRSAHYPQQ